MGSQSSALRKSKSRKTSRYEPSEEKAEVSETEREEKSPYLQQNQSLQEEGGVRNRNAGQKTQDAKEETLSEKTVCSEGSRALPDELTVEEVNTSSACLSEAHDRLSDTTEKEEADWVDNNRAYLIQSVSEVMPVADELLQRKMIFGEMYNNIWAASTSQEKMRVLYNALTSVEVKSAFYRILQSTQPGICQTEEIVKKAIREHKKHLREKYTYEFEGIRKDHNDAKPLDKIYTELHIIQGESEYVNNEHEIWEIEDKTRSQTTEGRKINCNDIFTSTAGDSGSVRQDGKKARPIKTVMTKGIAGIGKTVSVKKFILDWADGKANQDLDFIFMLPFRELNLIINAECQFSLVTLVRDFHPELRNIAIARIFDNSNVLFIFDGLDETQLQLNFKMTERLTDTSKESSVDTLVTNLVRKCLLPKAFVWITSRPGAVHRIPRELVNLWTEVRGFDNPQKEEYFRNRIEDQVVAETIINNITTSRSLYIMCHIPIFCWIAAEVLTYLLQKMSNTEDEDIKIPTTLTEMYTHFLSIQMQIAAEKYDTQNVSKDAGEVFKSNEEFILKLSRMAFECLNAGKIIFTANDLENYGIDTHTAGVSCGLCTEILKQESVFNRKKLYCFVHLTVQEYFAALFAYHSFARKKIDSQRLKDFLTIGSEEELEAILDEDPVDLPLDELVEIAIANSALREAGELDMFLRFLIGMSVQSTQDLLQGLIQQTEEHSSVCEEIRKSLREIDLLDCSAERCLNHLHCLMELNERALHDSVRQYLEPNHSPETQLNPFQCSALADLILMSNTPLHEFDLRRYRPSPKGVFRLLPAVRNSEKVRISGVSVDVWISETIISALQKKNSVVTELHLTNCEFVSEGEREGSTQLFDGLMNFGDKLKALSLSGTGHAIEHSEKLTLVVKSFLPNLRELELSDDILRGYLCSVFSDGLGSVETLRLKRNAGIAKICKVLVTALTSSPCCLRELDLSYTTFDDSDVETLYTGLMSTTCTLTVLSLSHNRLSDKGCQTLAAVLGSTSSSLTDLDLSYNDVGDSGVTVLCSALMNQHCPLERLWLSFCKVTGDGCADLASALRSDHCRLRELDLSFNHLTDQGVKLLTEIQEDALCSLEKLNVEQNEEYWFDFKILRQYACDLTLDPNTVAPDVILSENNKRATYTPEKQPYPPHLERFEHRQVLCEQGLTSRHYWEVECDSADVGVVYKSMARNGDSSSEYDLGHNEKSWCWDHVGAFCHNAVSLKSMDQTTYKSTIGVYLDWPAGILSFFEVFPDKLSHLYTVSTTFTEPLCPGFSLDDSIYIRALK